MSPVVRFSVGRQSGTNTLSGGRARLRGCCTRSVLICKDSSWIDSCQCTRAAKRMRAGVIVDRSGAGGRQGQGVRVAGPVRGG